MGKQVYISDQHHKRLKVASMITEQDMNEIVEKKIEEIDVDGLETVMEEI